MSVHRLLTLLHDLYREIVLQIITSNHWDKAMRMCTENNMTPMRLLIIHMPGMCHVGKPAPRTTQH